MLVWDHRQWPDCRRWGTLRQHTVLSNGNTAANGFAALAELDSNADGIIDANDEPFSQLMVWSDSNSDGLVSEGELLTLEFLDIQSLNLAYTSQNFTDEQSDEHRQIGSCTLSDGTVLEMSDIWFNQDTARTIETDLVEGSEDIVTLDSVVTRLSKF